MQSDGTGLQQRTENTNEKGQRNEREACDILKAHYGAGVEKVDTFTNHDPFGFVDIIAMQPGEKVRYNQVKTNTVSAEAISKYKQHLRKLPPEHAEFEIWVRVDREGWRCLRWDGEEFEKVFELPCNTTDARVKYRKVIRGD